MLRAAFARFDVVLWTVRRACADRPSRRRMMMMMMRRRRRIRMRIGCRLGMQDLAVYHLMILTPLSDVFHVFPQVQWFIMSKNSISSYCEG